MKLKKQLFYFLHFIIFSYNFFLLSTKNTFSNFYSPNYIISNLSNIFPKNYSSTISTTIKELLFTNETDLSSKYSYFLVTSKSGKISVISNNKTFFSIDFKKIMNETNIEQTNIINEDKVVLAFEGKLFIVKNYLDMQNFEEFTTPISELVDMTPFSLGLMPDYYFLSDKKYSVIKITKNYGNKYNFDIDLNLIIFVDYTLICFKDKEQVWNTTITNVYFINKNEEKNIKIKKIKIDELILIYENNEELEKNIKGIIGNKYNDTLSIHGYDKIRKKYVKIYDFNTFSHIIQNNTINNMEEKNNNNNQISSLKYETNVSEKYEQIDNIIKYGILTFIILCILFLILYNFNFNFLSWKFESSKIFKNNSFNDNNYIENNIQTEELDNIITFKRKASDKNIFQNIQNNFKENENINKNNDEIDKRKKTVDLLQKNFDFITKREENERQNILKSLRKDLFKANVRKSLSNKNINNLKKIKKSLNISSISNSNTEKNEVSPEPNPKNANDINNLDIDKKKFDNKEEFNLKNEISSSSLTRLEKDFQNITLIKKINIGIILKAKHKIDEEIYIIKIIKLSNPNDEKSVILEAKNMTKIHTKHIVEYITCWFDKSLGKYENLFGEENDKEILSQSFNDIEEKNSSSKSNKKVFKEDKILNHQISQEETKDEHYIKKLYDKSSNSDNEFIINKKKFMNIENKYYKKKNSNEDNKIQYKNNYLDDSLIESKISQKNIPNLNMYFFIQMEYCEGLTLSKYMDNNSETGLSNKIMYTFTYQIIKSLAKIHENKIVHRGINPDNIFVINDSQIKIGGLSSAKEIKSSKIKKKHNKNKKIINCQSMRNINEYAKNCEDIDLDNENFDTSLYLSPEQEQGGEMTEKSDVYSVGLVLYEMCECLDKNQRQKKVSDLKKRKIFDEKVKKLFNLQCKLIIKMVENKPENRPKCEDLLNSEEMNKWKKSIEENN